MWFCARLWACWWSSQGVAADGFGKRCCRLGLNKQWSGMEGTWCPQLAEWTNMSEGLVCQEKACVTSHTGRQFFTQTSSLDMHGDTHTHTWHSSTPLRMFDNSLPLASMCARY